MTSAMDIMTARDSFHQEEEIIFFDCEDYNSDESNSDELNSDEFMMDSLTSPVSSNGQITTESISKSTSPTIKSPTNVSLKYLDQRPLLQKEATFTSESSDGIIVKPKAPRRKQKNNKKPTTFTPIFSKASLLAVRAKESPRPKSTSLGSPLSIKCKSPTSTKCKSSSPRKKKLLSISLSPPNLFARTQSLDGVMPETNITEALETPKRLEKKTTWSFPSPQLTSSKSVSKCNLKVRESAGARMESSDSIDHLMDSARPLKPKAASWIVSPCSITAPPSSPSLSSSLRSSTRSRKLSAAKLQRAGRITEPPQLKSPKSTWLLSPAAAAAPPTSRSARKSVNSVNSRKSKNVASGMPSIPDLDMDGVGADPKKKPQTSKRPLFLRPLDKILIRDVDSSSTETTFQTADMEAIDYSMSHILPMTKRTERLIFKRVPHNKREISIENSEGEKIAYLDNTMANEGKRFLKDKLGRFCAVIIHQNDKIDGTNVFKICGNRPASRKQRLSNETGYYTWAEVRNTGSLGGKFCMKKYSEETLTCSADQHVTKSFGLLFNTRKSRGYVFTDSKKKECVKMVILNCGGKGIMVAPDKDLCLMISYVAVVDEMIENRMI
jgi:hypothetical protein